MSHRVFDDGKSIEARQHLLDNRSEHSPKRHRTLGRRKRLKAAKRQAVKHKVAVTMVKHRRFLAAVRSFWNEDRDTHP